MIKIIKNITIKFTSHFMFRGISNINYKNIFDNFITQLTSLPIRENLNFLNDLRLNQLAENSIFKYISAPFGVN